MSSIDERVVGMRFNNAQFEAGAKTSMSTLDKLKASLNFDGAKKGIDNLSTAAKGLDLSGLGKVADGVATRFSAMEVVAVGALLNIGAKAVQMGASMIKSLTLDPIMAGFGEYELKMGSIQTILANTARYGTKLPEVTAALDDLNTYSDKTIYNFGDMTKNVGLFTNAGIGIKDATSMIKGFSNAAAASGTTAEGAAGAAYQLSQALSTGKVTLMDWRSLTNVGMGNKNMQDGVIQLATAMGTFKGTGTDANAVAKDFNGSLEKGWLKADVMSNYLKIMAGDMDAGAMAALGLSQAQIDGFTSSAQTAQDAATKVRTFTQLIGTMREAVGSTWAQTAEIVLGDFESATGLFTSINDKVGAVIGKMGAARNAMLQGWSDLGGRQDLIDIGDNIWKSISNIIAPITQAWAKIFPADGGKGLKGFTGAIKTVTDVLVKITSGLVNLAPIFEIVFGVFKFGMSIVSGLAGYLVNLFAVIGGIGTGTTLGLVGGFAALIAKVIEFINAGQYVQKFFAALQGYQTAVLAPMVDFVNRIAQAFQLLVKGDTQGFFDGIKNSVQAFAPLVALISAKVQALAAYFKGLAASIQNMGTDMQGPMGTVVSLLQKASGYLVNFAAGIKGVSDILTKGDFGGASKTFGFDEDSKAVGVLFGIRDALTGVKTASDNVTTSATGLVSTFKGGVSDTGTQVVTIWQRIADAFKAVSTWLAPAVAGFNSFLSWIGGQVKKVISDLSGQDMLALINTGLFMAAYLSIKKFMDSFRTLFTSASRTFDNIGAIFATLNANLVAMQDNVKAGTLMKIGIAIALLAASIWVLSTIKVGDLTAATVAIALLLKMLMLSMESFASSVQPVETAKILALGVTLTLVAVAVLLLSAALKIFAAMSWEELAKGVLTLGIVLKILTSEMDQMPVESMLKNAAALVVIAIAMQLFAVAILAFSAMDIGTVAEGLAYIAASLVVLGLAMKVMPEESMLKNAAAIAVLSVALLLLAVVIKTFAALDVQTVAEAMAYIGVSLLVLGVGMMFMQNAMSGALALVVVSVGLMLLAKALQMFASIDIGTIVKALLTLVAMIVIMAVAAVALTPIIPIMIALGLALALLGGALFLAGAGAMLFALAFTMLGAAGLAGAAGFTAAMMAILQILPLAAQQLGLAILAFAVVISEGGPAIVAALTTLLLSLIAAIVAAVPPFIDACVVLILKLLEAIVTLTQPIIDTMIVLIKALVNAIVVLIPFFVDAGLKIVTGVLNGISNNIGRIITAGTNLVVNFLNGLNANMGRIISAGTDLIITFVTGIGNAAGRIAEAAMSTVVKFVNSLASSIRSNSGAMNTAGSNLAGAIVDGITSGLRAGVGSVVGAAGRLVAGIPDAIKSILHINSPSKVTRKIALGVGEGVVLGIDDMGMAVYNAATRTGNQAVQGLNKGMSNASDLALGVNLNPVIKPVLDLTDVQAGAKQMNSLLAAQPIMGVTSSNSARDISTSTQAAQEAISVATEAPESAITYNQYNTSPKEISPAEVYRQTKNQLSVQAERLRANAH